MELCRLSVSLRIFTIIWFVVSHSGTFIKAWPTLRVEILNYTHTFAPGYVQYDMFPAKGSAGYEVRLSVRRDDINIIAKFAVFFENVEFLNKTINVCKVAKSYRSEPLLRLIYKVLSDNPKANVPRHCPVKKGNYSNFLLIETDQIPPVWPEDIVYIYIDFFSNEKQRLVPILSSFIKCQFRKKKIGSS